MCGCATDLRREAVPQPAVSPVVEAAAIEFILDAHIEVHTGYHRMIPAGSVWEAIARLPHGLAYKRRNGVFTLEGAHIHEAHIVIDNRTLVGFYLPVERAFSPMAPLPILTREIQPK